MSPTIGGTGVNNSTNTITVGGNTAFSGAFAFTGTITAATTVTFPTTGTLATTAQLPTLPLTLANGGTGANITASNGGIFYSTATVGALLAGTATASQVLLSGASTAPVWSTATYPAATVINQLLYSSANNTMAGLATANSAVLVTTSTGVPGYSSTITNGQVIIGSTGATPTAATITAGTGVSVTNGAGSITIATVGSAIAWVGIAGTTQTAAVNTGYIIQNAGQTTVTLPVTAAIGSVVSIRGLGAGGWILAAGTGQTIQLDSTATSSGGSLTYANQYDTVDVTCIVANTTWSVNGVISSGLTVA